ncbi:MAG: phosphoribosylformylglycinamidine cyclo-ligase [Spirochaetota bacterium]|nr:phosphoribosylformylglycinamidine cyclo-ligase [Spirochaetota bacterium]
MDDLTYKKSGVDIDAGNEAVERMKPLVKKTFRKEVLTGLGGFGGLFQLDLSRYREPVLVSGTDGVGSKLKTAFLAKRHNTVGIDLVAMAVNDIICSGAEPLYFLDYIGIGKLDPQVVEEIVEGVAEGCSQCGAALIGGETAEMPDMYGEGEYDLAGFAVGVVEKSEIIDGSTVSKGDLLLGLASSGFHSNGYSLIRNILFKKHGYSLNEHIEELGRSLKDILLEPTLIYYRVIERIRKAVKIKALAHITGGGLEENLVRVIPEGLGLKLYEREIPQLFQWIQRLGNVRDEEMARVFNMGVGMALIVSPDDAGKVREELGDEIISVGEVI